MNIVELVLIRGVMVAENGQVDTEIVWNTVWTPAFAENMGKLMFWCGEDKILYGGETPIWQPRSFNGH